MSVQAQDNKLSGHSLRVALAPLHAQGRAYKVFIPVELSTFFREQGISKVQLLQDGDGGIIVIKPLLNRELDKVYEKGREIFEMVKA